MESTEWVQTGSRRGKLVEGRRHEITDAGGDQGKSGTGGLARGYSVEREITSQIVRCKCRMF